MEAKYTKKMRVIDAGFGLLNMMLLVFVLSGLVVAGTIAIRAKSPSLAAQNQTAILSEADKAVVTFATLNNRLPCPGSTRDGLEDCSYAGQIGWLPYRSLGLENAGNKLGAGQLRYLVQRASIDLSVANDYWQPIKSDSSGAYSATRTFATVNIGLPDLCAKLSTGDGITLQPTHAQAASVAPRALAYALVHPGSKDEDGDGNLFDAENAMAGNSVAPSERETKVSVYDDRVFEKKYSDLLQQLHCQQLNTSINLVSLAAEAVDEVHAQAIVNTASGSVLTAISTVKATILAVKTIKAVASMATSIGYASTSAGLLAGAIAGCIFIVGCAELPHAIASVVAAAVSVVASTAMAVATGVAATLNFVSAGLSLSAAIVAGVSTEVKFDISAAVTQSLTVKNSATASAITAYSDWQSAISKETNLYNDFVSNQNNIFAKVRAAIVTTNVKGVPAGTQNVNSLDFMASGVYTAASNWNTAESNFLDASEAYTNAVNAKSGGQAGTNSNSTAATDAIQKIIDAETDPVKKQAMVDAKTALTNGAANASNNAQQVSQINAQIAKLDTQIATNPTNVTELQTLRAQLISQRNSISPDVPAALANKNAADAARTTAKTDYNNARNALVDATLLPYSVKTCKTSGSPPTETCKTEDFKYDGRTDTRNAVVKAFDDGTSKPNQGNYFKYVLQNRHTVAAKNAYDTSLTTRDQATSSYNSLAALNTGVKGTGTAVTSWNGANAILQEIDNKGGVR